MGCAVTLTIDHDGKVASITGHKCKQGKKYVMDEYENPVRTLTATVLTQVSSQRLLAVRTTAPIPKTKLMPGMMALTKVRAKPAIKMGDVIVSNLLDTGVDVVASSDLPF
jgi:CxxC motif-containing protein